MQQRICSAWTKETERNKTKLTETLYVKSFPHCVKICKNRKKILYSPFLWSALTCLKAAKPWQGTTKSPRIPGTHFINIGGMKGCVKHGRNECFNKGTVDCYSRTLTTRALLDTYFERQISFPMSFLLVNSSNAII